MQLTSPAFADGQPIPPQYAFCKPSAVGHVALSQNFNPPLAWAGVPQGAQSLVLICHDPDVPSRADDVNLDGHTVPADLPRVDFYHWLLVDMPATRTHIGEKEFSNAVTARGKAGPDCSQDNAGPSQGILTPGGGLGEARPWGRSGGMRQGVNDYTAWFAGDQDMAGQYFGYDGPCPPWNDSLLHHYIFTLYALDVARCPVDGAFNGAQLRAALAGHVLAQASLTGTYTLNPALR
jgi:Raf kinase inhibitor-like YbhB/YbcL family protein